MIAQAYAWQIIMLYRSCFFRTPSAVLGDHRTELNQLCHMFGSQSGLKCTSKIWGSFPTKRGPQIIWVALRRHIREYLQNETSYGKK